MERIYLAKTTFYASNNAKQNGKGDIFTVKRFDYKFGFYSLMR